MNYLHLAGHMGSDPETRFTSTGKKVTTFRLATNSRKANEDVTVWWRITIWGEQFDKMIPYLKKGSAIMVVGELQKPEIFTDRDGKPQVSLNVTAIHISFPPFGKPGERSSQQEGQQEQPVGPGGSAAPFGQMREASSPYTPPGVQSGKMPAMQVPGSTMDDEVPF